MRCARRRFRPRARPAIEPVVVAGSRFKRRRADPPPTRWIGFCETFGAPTALRARRSTRAIRRPGPRRRLIVTGGELPRPGAGGPARRSRSARARGRFRRGPRGSGAAVELVGLREPRRRTSSSRIVDPYSCAPGRGWCGGRESGSPVAAWRRATGTAPTPRTPRSRRAGATTRPPGPYARTGDLGFVAGGQLYVTGRHKGPDHRARAQPLPGTTSRTRWRPRIPAIRAGLRRPRSARFAGARRGDRRRCRGPERGAAGISTAGDRRDPRRG